MSKIIDRLDPCVQKLRYGYFNVWDVWFDFDADINVWFDSKTGTVEWNWDEFWRGGKGFNTLSTQIVENKRFTRDVVVQILYECPENIEWLTECWDEEESDGAITWEEFINELVEKVEDTPV